MKTIVAFKSPDLSRELTPDLLRRLDLELVLVGSTRELLEALHRGADLCFLDRILPDGDGADACALIRADRKLAPMPVVLLTAMPLSVGASAQGFSEVVELPAAPGAIRLVVGRLLGVPLRDNDRGAVRVNVYGRHTDDASTHREFLGVSVDLSERGMLIKSQQDRVLEKGTELELAFALPGQARQLDLRATVVRANENVYAPARAVALSFHPMEDADREVIRKYLGELLAGWPFWWAVSREGARERVSLAGALQADSDLTALEQLRGDVDFRLRDLRRISPESLQRWVELMRRLRGAARVRLVECPVPLIQLAAMTPEVLDGVEVLSFLAPYSCARCGIEDERIIEVEAMARATSSAAASPREPPAFACQGCGGPLALDDLPARYFAFMDR